ncbi:sugar transferase [Defluviimonas sp. D31]|uniref:sugar transferase n=1 Tax=Defluviimonas sp. D31 TaxID=3083253 RepID=UPI00296EEF9B|nr:sugar transferase [Defluviimonas sp. D31]MDW4549734.1 sugar transferase [Defluviimonas sp. D31]
MTILHVSPQPAPSQALNRAFDIALATAGLIVLAPLMLLITLAILIETGRPILFAQVRLGKGGKRFRMFKFRKFGPAPATQGCPLTVKGDPRMTRVGRILEATKLDELPQLFNILRGDMAFVGPRPESLDFADCFKGAFLGVLDHRPGIFGPSQVAFRSEAELYPAENDPTVFYRRVLFPTKANLDLQYYPNRTALRDVGWLLRGVLAVLGAPASDAPLAEQSATKAARRRVRGRGTGRHKGGSVSPVNRTTVKRSS